MTEEQENLLWSHLRDLTSELWKTNLLLTMQVRLTRLYISANGISESADALNNYLCHIDAILDKSQLPTERTHDRDQSSSKNEK